MSSEECGIFESEKRIAIWTLQKKKQEVVIRQLKKDYDKKKFELEKIRLKLKAYKRNEREYDQRIEKEQQILNLLTAIQNSQTSVETLKDQDHKECQDLLEKQLEREKVLKDMENDIQLRIVKKDLAVNEHAQLKQLEEAEKKSEKTKFKRRKREFNR